jgi:hypothetical protein
VFDYDREETFGSLNRSGARDLSVRRVADDEGIENPDRPHLRPSIAHSCTSFSSGSAGTTTLMVILSLPNSIETVTPRARRRGLGKMRLRHRNLRFQLDVEVAKDEGFEEARRTYGAKKG